MIGIVDYGMGNLRSVANAVLEVGHDPLLVSAPDGIDGGVSHLIVPGVGHFGTAMRRLAGSGMADAIRGFAASGRPVLGVCLGMQLLAGTGTEGGETAGLGLVPGRVRKLPNGVLPVPHIGWNTVTLQRAHPVAAGLKDGRDFYFVHSFVVDCDDEADVLGSTDYGDDFTSVVAHGNVVGFQFHPEKSQVNGLRLLENFCDWDGAC